MKSKAAVFVMSLVLAGCSFISTPTATVKKFMTAAQKGDTESMTALVSSQSIQKLGLDKVKDNNQKFAELIQKASSSSSYRIEGLEETRSGDGARVSFFYKNDTGTDSTKLVFDLVKEEGYWKIVDLAGAEKDETGTVDSPSPEDDSKLVDPPPPPLPPVSEKNNSATSDDAKSNSNRAPISGGILNGKAISLPKPPYPPVAKAVKAEGTVNVQVVVDENGNVISAQPVSGHPLLRAAAAAAARAAKFPPTKLSGEPVKVTGIITYKFLPE